MIYAIGDIHGHLDQLVQAHELIAFDRAERGGAAGPVIHMGDLVDRGPDSKGVIQFLIDGLARGEDWIVLRGNHDHMFATFAQGGDGTSKRLRPGITWQSDVMGGAATLASYGVRRKPLERKTSFLARARKKIPRAHVEFLSGLTHWLQVEGKIFVHAGIRPGFPMDAQDEEDLMWIRDEFLWHSGPHERLIVHGHTPVEEPTHYGNRINIDTGAGWGNPLVPVVFEGEDCFALTRDGRVAVKSPDRYYQ